MSGKRSKKTTEEEERQSGKGWAETDVFCFFFLNGKSSVETFLDGQ